MLNIRKNECANSKKKTSTSENTEGQTERWMVRWTEGWMERGRQKKQKNMADPNF